MPDSFRERPTPLAIVSRNGRRQPSVLARDPATSRLRLAVRAADVVSRSLTGLKRMATLPRSGPEIVHLRHHDAAEEIAVSPACRGRGRGLVALPLVSFLGACSDEPPPAATKATSKANSSDVASPIAGRLDQLSVKRAAMEVAVNASHYALTRALDEQVRGATAGAGAGEGLAGRSLRT